MVDVPAFVEWVNGELRAYPDAEAPDHSHALARPFSLRIGPDGLLRVRNWSGDSTGVRRSSPPVADCAETRRMCNFSDESALAALAGAVEFRM
jgi:hypothetical protein